jgi:hypothetical protein
VRAGTAVILIVISLAAVGGVAYGVYRTDSENDQLRERVTALEQNDGIAAGRADRLETDRQKLCASVNRVRQKITGVVLKPNGRTPNFDVLADPLSAPERIILMLYNWCHAGP